MRGSCCISRRAASRDRPPTSRFHAKEILSLRRRLNEIYVTHTGQEIAIIEDNLERDKFMTPPEAKDFGIVDDVVARRPAAPNDSEGKGGAKKGS